MGTLLAPQTVADTTKGFNDPNGTYPSEKITHSNHALQESDVNRLARNDTEKNTQSYQEYRRTTPLVAAHLPLDEATLHTALIQEPRFRNREWTLKNMTIQVDRREYTISQKGTFYEIDKDGNKLQEWWVITMKCCRNPTLKSREVQTSPYLKH